METRFPRQNLPKTSRRLSNQERILDLPGRGYKQHWTRSLAFSPDGKRMFVSLGSKTNVSLSPILGVAQSWHAIPTGRTCESMRPDCETL